MYFDVVLGFYGIVLFNGTPEETKKFIRREISSLQPDAYVMQGVSMKTFSLKEYMDL